MKKTLIIIAIAAAGCKPEKVENPVPVTKEYSDSNFKIIELDSCEYVTRHVYMGYSICHKGNCKYCKQRNNGTKNN